MSPERTGPLAPSLSPGRLWKVPKAGWGTAPAAVLVGLHEHQSELQSKRFALHTPSVACGDTPGSSPRAGSSPLHGEGAPRRRVALAIRI
jgi:hypothetical protein